MNEFIELFIEESKEYIEKLNEDLKVLEKDYDNEEIINDIFRIFHTLKGMSGMVELTEMYSYLHEFENILQPVKRREKEVDKATVGELKKAKKKIQNIIDEVSNSSKDIKDIKDKKDTIDMNVIFNNLRRMVSELEQKTNKRVVLNLNSNVKNIDKKLATKISEIIVHLIRNAIDHGIETPSERFDLGKKVTGNIGLSFIKDENYITLIVSDDGRGINLDKIKQKAVLRKLKSKTEIEKMSKKEIIDLLFVPGFTTNDKVTTVSGRGFGLDIVKAIANELDGVVNIQTKEKKGTIVNVVI